MAARQGSQFWSAQGVIARSAVLLGVSAALTLAPQAAQALEQTTSVQEVLGAEAPKSAGETQVGTAISLGGVRRTQQLAPRGLRAAA